MITKKLKPFKLKVEGTFCDVPHKERLFMLYNDSDRDIDKELHLTNIDIMVICHEISCCIKRRLQSVMTNEEMKKQAKNFDRYHFGNSTGKEKLMPFAINIVGNHCEHFTLGRKLEYNLETITEGRANLVLYEIVCNLRNELSKTMSREELMNIAIQHKMYNLGMLPNEVPFDIRDDGKIAE